MNPAFVNEIDRIQEDMAKMEGLLETLAIGACHGARAECIGNSLEVLKEYLGNRADRLDFVGQPFRGCADGAFQENAAGREAYAGKKE